MTQHDQDAIEEIETDTSHGEHKHGDSAEVIVPRVLIFYDYA